MNMLFKALLIAFSMYSKIPAPNVSWEDKSMKYAFCFFPVVGMVIGAVVWFCTSLLLKCNFQPLLIGCVLTVLPVALTGGIHFDGFLDTMDAISSYAHKERRLEILKDSNSGAFAIIGGLCYFTLSVGFCSNINLEIIEVLAVGYVLSRALSGLAVVTFPMAKNTGLLATFSNKAHKRIVAATMLVFILISVLALYFINVKLCLGMLFVSVALYVYHYYNCVKNFGGITGDLSGFFLQLIELAFIIVSVVISEVI